MITCPECGKLCDSPNYLAEHLCMEHMLYAEKVLNLLEALMGYNLHSFRDALRVQYEFTWRTEVARNLGKE